jgi:pimeloyl-ACP methyl ester carboxylesterase
VTVLLLPSLGRSVDDLADLGAALIAEGHRVVSIELCQLGGGTLGELADQIARRSAGPVDLVGHAFGNRVARLVAARHPTVVRSIVLLGAGGEVPGDPDAREALARCFDGLPAAEHLASVRTAFFGPRSIVPPAWIAGWDRACALAQQRALEASGDDGVVLAVGHDLLVVQGLADRIAPPENGRGLVERAHAAGHRAELVEVAGAGHALLPEQPDEVTQAVATFLRAGPGVRPRGSRAAGP